MANTQESVIFLTSDKETKPFHKVQIHWNNQDVENVLVVVHDKGGNLSGLLLSDKPKFAITCTGCDTEQTYTIHIYGLQKTTQTKTAHDHNVKASGKGTVSYSGKKQNSTNNSVQTSVVRLEDHCSCTYEDLLINVLKINLHGGSLNDTAELGVSVRHQPPLTYTIYPQLPLKQKVRGMVTICLHGRPHKESLIVSYIPLPHGIDITSMSRSRTLYQVSVLATCDRVHCQLEDFAITTYQGGMNSSSIIIKTCMVKDDLLQLLQRAKTYCNSHMKAPWTYYVTQFYRNEPKSYYNDIFTNHEGIMKKYIKDNNGDPFSPVNNKINGLFFSASVNPFTRRPPDFSYYGDTRLFIPVEEMFTSDTNLYFTDFYCHYETHYVTIVLTKKGSDEDQFCQGRLIQLDPKDNPFFWIEGSHVPSSVPTAVHLQQNSLIQKHPTYCANNIPIQSTADIANIKAHGVNRKLGECLFHPVYSAAVPPGLTGPHTYYPIDGYSIPLHQNGYQRASLDGYMPTFPVQKMFKTNVVAKFHLEFFYTEDIDIRGLMSKCGQQRVYFEFVEGRGQSRKNGIPKRADCSVCNLP